jgi:hypothetical protein
MDSGVAIENVVVAGNPKDSRSLSRKNSKCIQRLVNGR